MTEKQPNHLLKESSPYLLQHAFNPVDWHPWGDDALKIAREQNKLLVISIGYAACHWCHVMEHESFEDEEVAGVMNRDFVSMKIDREERPDIDQLYMAAAYATTGRGGWPLNVIALPDQRPVFAGTYFSKKDWIYILGYFRDLYHSRPEDLLLQASEIALGMKKQHLPSYPAESMLPDTAMLHGIFTTLEADLDGENGGTYGAPKFPMPANISFLLNYATQQHNARALDHVTLTLDKMAMGGIYDHLGGGFSRYSVDARWYVPHFEKMLYDNAQLISLYSQAYAVTKNITWKRVVEESVGFIERELTGPNGLFFASLDADSEGAEGAYYAWTYDEIIKYLGDDPSLFLDYYSCDVNGNWEHHLNVLRKSAHDDVFAEKHGLSRDDLSACLEVYKTQLLTVRGNRIRPATDDKILTCWNALMISALVDASKVFNRHGWLEKAVAAAAFYRDHVTERSGKLWRCTREESFAIAGFLDDYCFLIKAFLDVYQATLDETWLTAADLLNREVLVHFTAGDGLFFRLSSDEQPPLIQETIEMSDNVIPASNSQMARNLLILGHLLGNESYLKRSEEMLQKMIPAIRRNPAFHANWAQLLADFISGPIDVTISGEEKLLRLHEFAGWYLPRAIFSGSPGAAFPVSDESRVGTGKTLILVCHRKTCFSPVETTQEALAILNEL